MKTAINKTYIQRNLFAIMFLLTIAFLSIQCIEEYDPGINEKTDLIAIDASVVRGREEQTILITRSTSIENTSYIPVQNCVVSVTDNRNNVFLFEEKTNGKYVANIDMLYLNIGAKFKLTVKTPDNNVYESGFEEIQECPPIDSLYFLEETNYSEELKKDINGLRLYVELTAREGYANYYRWKLNDTWEFRTFYHIDEKYIGTVSVGGTSFVRFNTTDSLSHCWKHSVINGLYSASTVNLVKNGRKNIPLHYVFGNNERLYFRYSCLVGQYSLDERAYEYWQNKKIEIQESGGIYFKQPSQTISNIVNVNNSEEVVLGYFWVSSLKEKRIFFEGPLSPWGYNALCVLDTFNVEEYINAEPEDLPIYLIYDNSGLPPDERGLFTAEKKCFDCRLFGGSINRPDFW